MLWMNEIFHCYFSGCYSRKTRFSFRSIFLSFIIELKTIFFFLSFSSENIIQKKNEFGNVSPPSSKVSINFLRIPYQFVENIAMKRSKPIRLMILVICLPSGRHYFVGYFIHAMFFYIWRCSIEITPYVGHCF